MNARVEIAPTGFWPRYESSAFLLQIEHNLAHIIMVNIKIIELKEQTIGKGSTVMFFPFPNRDEL